MTKEELKKKKRKEEARNFEIWAHEERERIKRMREMLYHPPFMIDF